MVGHYCGASEVRFEMTLPIEDGEVSDKQLGRILWTVSREVVRTGAKIRALARGEKIELMEDPVFEDPMGSHRDTLPEMPDDAGIDELMQRLFHETDERSGDDEDT
jgi:hypothetical protein